MIYIFTFSSNIDRGFKLEMIMGRNRKRISVIIFVFVPIIKIIRNFHSRSHEKTFFFVSTGNNLLFISVNIIFFFYREGLKRERGGKETHISLFSIINTFFSLFVFSSKNFISDKVKVHQKL